MWNEITGTKYVIAIYLPKEKFWYTPKLVDKDKWKMWMSKQYTMDLTC